jgi:serine/threonine protein kinase/formylglycine-generating enzyme required for sulfatase activity/Leucine-rich repeat (LRR) protein
VTEDQVFLAALDIPDAATRSAYLDEVCGENASLRRQVEALLVAHLKSGEFLDTPAPEQAGMDTHPSGAATIQTSDISETVDFTEEPERLSFLGPPTRPGSLGRLEHYEALQVLGRGAFGIVLRAFDEVLQRVVAIKVMAPQLAATSPARKRFLREARSSAQVRHENVVQVYDVKEKPLPFLVMEYIPGETLQERLDRIGPLEVPEVLQIGRQIAEGLAAAHAKDLIHRDIKPGNILLEGDQHKAKITDFGLARAADDASMTQSGMIAGTPLYMAPEQALGHTLDQRADLFSLGSVLYQMVTGRPPFRANSTIAVLKRVTEDTPRDMREIISETPAWLCDIIAKLHAKDPDDRYQSAREVADVLADCEEQLKQNSRLQDYSRIPKQRTVAPAETAGSPAATRGRIAAAGAVLILLPLLALAISEFTGATKFFHSTEVSQVPVESPLGTTPVANDKASPDADGWVQLFNGRDLTGWNAGPGTLAAWQVEENVLIGRGPEQSYLYSERGDYKDFHLRAEAKINPEGNAGIHFHVSKPLVRLNGAPSGYEVQIAGSLDPNHTGSLFKFPVQDWLLAQVKESSAMDDSWFVFEIIAQGQRVITRVNGKTVVDIVDAGPTRGHLALQVFENNVVVQFRKIEIKELPASPPAGEGFVALFNGQDLTGWKFHPDHPGHWEVKNGILRGSKRQSHLFTERGDYKNFHLRAEVKINQGGDSGILFRAPLELRPGRTPTEFGIPGCYEAELQHNRIPARPTGSISEAPGGAPPTILGRALDGSMSEPDEWFTYEVIAENNHFITKINGVEAANCHDQQSRHEAGHIALQVWQANTLVQLRKVEIKELPAEASTLPSTLTNSLGMEFVLVPKGKSWLGGGKDKMGDQEVEIPADFYLGKYEVMQEEWEKLMGKNPSHFSRTGGGKEVVKNIPDADLKRLPVESVSWEDCQSFVAKLNERDRETGWVYRMPTEVEWEYACRGGPHADKFQSNFDFYFNEPTNFLLAAHANIQGSGLNRTCKVGLYAPNTLGLFDMHGNVWEWCDDLTKVADESLRRVNRGGSWGSDPEQCRAAARFGGRESSSRYSRGLRLARVPSDAPSPEVKTPPLAAAPFTDADVQRIAALPAEQQVAAVVASLKQRNPGLNGTASHKIVAGVVTEFNFNPTDDQNALTDLSPVRALAGLTSLNLWNCSALADLGPLQGLPLTKLLIGSLDVSNQIRDLKPLQGMRLTELQLYQCQVEDLKPLAGMPLNRLRVFSRHLRNCEPLKGMPLTTLDLSYCTQIQDFTPLTGLPLTGLHLNACQIRDLQPLLGLKLTEVSLAGTRVRDLQQLKGMPLKNLAIQRTGVTDLTPLQGMELKEIFLSPKTITQGLNHLRDMKSLHRIGIGYASTEKWPAAEFWERYEKGEFAPVPFTEADAKRIAALPVAEQVEEVRKELIKRNPGFDGKLTPTTENGVVTEFSVNTDQILDISPIRALTGLVYLDLRGTYPNKGKLSDLSPLKGTSITRLDCSSTQIADLSPLAGLPLTFLHFNHNPVSDLTPLTGMPLEELGLAETKVVDLSPLQGMKIKVLGAQILPVTDLSPLAGMPLKGLDLYHTIGVTSLEPLRGMPLEGLNLQDVPVSDLSPLAGMTTLRTLLLQGNKVSDLSPLAGLQLTDLLVFGEQITDLTPLKGQPLSRLTIYETGVSDLRPLAGMPLVEIRLNPKNITQGLDVLREINTLQSIGIDGNRTWPPAEFWERYEKGEFTK